MNRSTQYLGLTHLQLRSLYGLPVQDIHRAHDFVYTRPSYFSHMQRSKSGNGLAFEAKNGLPLSVLYPYNGTEIVVTLRVVFDIVLSKQ